MITTISQPITLEEFWDWYPDGYGRYELHDGAIFEMQPIGNHEEVISFLTIKLAVQIEKLDLPYLIPKQALIKPLDTNKSAYNPDVLILDKSNLNNESLWKTRSTITQGKTVPLVIEVVSSNWGYDYGHKLIDYEALGITEYWIVDYLGLGGKRYIGDPKKPTISIYQLVDDEYQVKQFRNNDALISSVFPDLNLTAQQIFDIAN
ncbi:Uma2 family endonuclease [Cyanothece sp. BG0011]|uniref:Uma2 family endonuclease n=1 Tax=Cyanothece sp. BG0011 TaxID=2082950 RepID=UPI000D1ED567|nr:Uma2 family endonuclease [Cyanothece sp. BG0011]